MCATLIEIRRADLMPTDNEITVMETFVEIMRPITEITEVMGGEKCVTLSAMRLFLYKLLNKYLVVKPTDSNISKEIKTAVKANAKQKHPRCKKSARPIKSSIANRYVRPKTLISVEAKKLLIKNLLE